MAQYIDKAALVAEIEKLMEDYSKYPTRNVYEDGLKDGRLIGYKDALYKINTLEVKDVDFQEKQEFLEKAYDGLKPLLDADSLMVVQHKLLELVYGMKVIE